MNRPLLSLLAVMLAGCRAEPAIPVPAIPPFSEIAGLELGMTAGDVRAARNVEFAPYEGLSETWGEGRIVYHISGTMTDHVEPDDTDRLTAVAFEHTMPGRDAEAAAEYARFIRDWTSVLGPPACKSDSPHITVWRSNGLELTARRAITTQPGTNAAVYLTAGRDTSTLAECRLRRGTVGLITGRTTGVRR